MKCNDVCEENIVHVEKVEDVKRDFIKGDEVTKLQELFKVLGDGTRIKILHAISRTELCVCDIASIINMSQSAVSHQLRILRNSRLVKHRKEGKVVYYSLQDNHVVQLFNQGLEHIRHD
ncbi:ArsR family transcriptional regulator [Fervidicella metallireducens AeB]|uniref:ArsR family transcriptional regulator n=1 Tax=Fervidicella metallireducens AeB TaxID=1403537 RepID=A0A017RRW7_9CLOT|nr:metalloregulator ArsR/SmtB family transcription factor [Fervidicella metallireducens]EYE87341.1 ArsR family transcriptional regulator [Fervidicella metallireducens AeB]